MDGKAVGGKKMKFVVLGCKGMLGSDVMQALHESKIVDNQMVRGFDSENLDITSKDELKKLIELRPDFVINCAAYTDVDGAESHKDLAYSVNVEGVKNIADACKELDCVLVHFSTDYVFDGSKELYDEDDRVGALNYYGTTKAE
ncbi:sugar nucleotide-binding protein, partial [Candidatus Woesearchaeota archaeon]|nr:sugar nucleotide-binding protein [Candidatus Woesearchaeota archaeon]